MTTLNTIIEEESTPDTEWKEKVRDWWYSIQDLLADKDICLHERKRVEIEQIIKEAITSRDTYWQERVRKAFKDHYWDSLEKDKDILMLHVDTLLDNLK